MGMLRKRVVPPGQSTVRDFTGSPGIALAPLPSSKALDPKREGQEAVGPKFGRDSAAEAGIAVRVYIHPLVKVIIFPTSFSVLPQLRVTDRAARAVTPANRSGVRNKNTP